MAFRDSMIRLVKPTVRVVPYIITQYLWFFILVLVYLVPVWIFPTYKSIIKPSNHNTEWSLDADPIVFAHITDIHIGNNNPKATEHFRTARDWILNTMKPNYIIATGDLVDNFINRLAAQNSEDWDIYKKEIENITSIPYLDMPGNHDEFGISSFESKNHSYIQGKNLTFDDFIVSKKKLTYENTNIYFIVFNAYKFPSPRGNHNYYPTLTKDYLDRLEKAYNGIQQNDIVLFFSHYPLCYFDKNTKSSSGKTIFDLVSDTKFPQYFISGHKHPDKTIQIHRGNQIEIIGVDLVSHNMLAAISIDHNRFVYTPINNSNHSNFIITSPIPTEYLTNLNPFNEENSYIRVRAYTNSSPDISVTGDVNTTLECRHAKDGNGYVCSAPFSLGAGNHQISFTGDFEQNLSFVINENVTFFEKAPNESYSAHRIYVFAASMIFVFAIMYPIKMPDIIVNCEKWIRLIEVENFTNAKGWIVSMLLGPVVFKMRFQNLRESTKIFIVFITLWIIIMPMNFFEIDDKLGIEWAYGIIYDMYIVNDDYSKMMASFFVKDIICGFLILATGCSVNADLLGPASIADYVYFGMIVLSCIKFDILESISNNGKLSAAFSPCFIISPIILLAVACFEKISNYIETEEKRNRGNKAEDNAINDVVHVVGV